MRIHSYSLQTNLIQRFIKHIFLSFVLNKTLLRNSTHAIFLAFCPLFGSVELLADVPAVVHNV